MNQLARRPEAGDVVEVFLGLTEWTFAGVGRVVYYIGDVYWVLMDDGENKRVHRAQLRVLETAHEQN